MRTHTRWHARLVARVALFAIPLAVGASVGLAAPAAAISGGVLTLTPPSQSALIGTPATVVANETVGGVAVVDAVSFLVTSGPNAGRSGLSTTPNATFTYVGNGILGTDTIQACATGAPAPCATATVTWSFNNFGNLGQFGVPAIDFHPDNSTTEVNNDGSNNRTIISDASGSPTWSASPFFFDDGWDGSGPWADDQWDD